MVRTERMAWTVLQARMEPTARMARTELMVTLR
jgi:hypothetical protein